VASGHQINLLGYEPLLDQSNEPSSGSNPVHFFVCRKDVQKCKGRPGLVWQGEKVGC